MAIGQDGPSCDVPRVLVGVEVRRSMEPGGGEGLFATRAWQPGDTVLAERPLAKLEAEAFDLEDSVMLAQAYGRLTDSGQLDILLDTDLGRALWRGPEDDHRRDAFRRCVEETWPEGAAEARARRAEAMRIFSYNSYMTQDGGRFHAVFPNLSKANHRCDPNCWAVVPDGAPGEVVCARRAAMGEELTVSYLCKGDLLRPLSRRRLILQDGWEFACQCSRCTADVDDARRFSCPHAACPGGCAARACGSAAPAPAVLEVAPCSACGDRPQAAVLQAWVEREAEIEALVEALPESLYSAWAPCEDFARDHPLHGLAGRWKNFIARRTQCEANQAEDEDERAALNEEVELHRFALHVCTREMLHEDFADRSVHEAPH